MGTVCPRWGLIFVDFVGTICPQIHVFGFFFILIVSRKCRIWDKLSTNKMISFFVKQRNLSHTKIRLFHS